jgi:HNH endonuclease
MAAADLTAARLRELLSYDPATGLFTRLVSGRGRGAIAGSVAGGKSLCGYIRIGVSGRFYMAHRLAWLYTHGVWPAGDIDHINGEKADNRLSNLRDVSTSVNMQNQRSAQPRNASGFLGVTRHGNRFEASIKINGVNLYLGSYGSPEEAHASYLKEKRRIHPGCTI